ncbi:MAG: acetoin utilization protein AcuC [Armatimonadetes bacterium]|nr:acetoin utilization protein AcuC [Armatimonadota bacterium]
MTESWKVHFYYSPRVLAYTFPEGHPYNSCRLEKAVDRLMEQGLVCEDFPDATDIDLARVHSFEYIAHLQQCSTKPSTGRKRPSMGIGTGDTPAFLGMYEACLAVAGASKAAATAIVNGSTLAFNLSGGLHHARATHASGFCAVDDIGVATYELLKRFDKVAYIDIDLHHGDGVEARFEGDEGVLTASVHQYGRGFYPGTGGHSIPGDYVNAPLENGDGDAEWLAAIEGLLVSVSDFQPQAIVLQMGVDAHFSDPLGGLRVTADGWLWGVRKVKGLGLPIVALGGGGYDHVNPARMWPAAVMELAGRPFPAEWLTDNAAHSQE